MIRLLVLLIALSMPLGMVHAQLQREVPTWRGITKTEEQIEADKKLIEEAKKLSDGDLKAAADQALELGWRSVMEGAPEMAIRRLNQAWLMDPDNGLIYWGFAIATHMRNDKLVDVTIWFDQAESILGPNANLYSNRGRVLDEREMPLEARQWFEKALTVDPDNQDAHFGMIRVAQAIGDDALRDKHQEIFNRLSQ